MAKKITGWEPAFLDMLSKTGNVRKSAHHVGLTNTTIYSRMNECADFAKQCEISRMKGKNKNYAASRKTQHSVASRVDGLSLDARKRDDHKRYLYILRESWRGLYKIGIASNLVSRVAGIQTSMPQSVEVVESFILRQARVFEKYLHNVFMDKQYSGEWYSLNDDDLVEIREMYVSFSRGDGCDEMVFPKMVFSEDIGQRSLFELIQQEKEP